MWQHKETTTEISCNPPFPNVQLPLQAGVKKKVTSAVDTSFLRDLSAWACSGDIKPSLPAPMQGKHTNHSHTISWALPPELCIFCS